MVYSIKTRRPSVPRLFDGFCGAGGSSLGCSWLGILVQLAINHNPFSLETHRHNFPNARHDCLDITAILYEDLKKYPRVEFGWFSSECTNHSNASGVRLLDQNQRPLWDDLDSLPHVERSRATMWEGLRWMEAMQECGSPYLAVVFENVNNVMLWKDIRPWYKKVEALGYRWQTISFNSRFAQAAFEPALADQLYPVGQDRNRWYTVCTLKENPLPDLDFRPRAHCPYCCDEVESVQTWKVCARYRSPKYGDYGEQYVYTCPRCLREVLPFFTPASALIDWDIPIERVGDKKKDLAPTTLQRIEKGLQRFCRGADQEPFLIDVSHTQSESGYVRSIWEACFTQTQAQTAGIVVPPGDFTPPFIFHTLRTPWEVNHKLDKASERIDKAVEKLDRAIERAKSTIKREQALEKRRALLEQRERSPMNEWSAYQAEVERYKRELPLFLRSYRERPTPPAQAKHAFAASYYNGSDVLISIDDAVRTCSSVDRHGLCIPPSSWNGGDVPPIEECLYRTLRSKETKRAMGIPEPYEIIATSQREETRQCGLAVTPAVAALLMYRVLLSLGEQPALQACA
jgi:site-specific DNA-cytosine methylase